MLQVSASGPDNWDDDLRGSEALCVLCVLCVVALFLLPVFWNKPTPSKPDITYMYRCSTVGVLHVCYDLSVCACSVTTSVLFCLCSRMLSVCPSILSHVSPLYSLLIHLYSFVALHSSF
jgi:hypothetical protein